MILIEAVQTLKQQPGPVQAHYERLLRTKGKPNATVAAARDLCLSIYWMWRDGLDYGTWLQGEAKRAGLLDANAGVVRMAPRDRR